MTGKKLPAGEEFAEEAVEECAAPHAEAEVWTPLPQDFGSSRALTAEERWPGEWHAICWMYAHGSSQKQIACELNYSESRVSVILNKPEVHEKIEQIRREFLGTESLSKKFSSIAPKATDFLSSVISGKEGARTGERLDASKWILEKVTGKAKQEVALDGGTTILQLLQALDGIKEAQAASALRPVAESPDIELEKQKPHDPLADWVSANVPEAKSEKGQG